MPLHSFTVAFPSFVNDFCTIPIVFETNECWRLKLKDRPASVQLFNATSNACDEIERWSKRENMRAISIGEKKNEMKWNEWCWVLIQRKNSDVTLRSSSVLKRKSVCVRACVRMLWCFGVSMVFANGLSNIWYWNQFIIFSVLPSIESILLHCVPIHFESKIHDFFNITNKNGQVYCNWVSLNCPSRLRVFVYIFSLSLSLLVSRFI